MSSIDAGEASDGELMENEGEKNFQEKARNFQI